eukprot:TRINITY_DN6417_c0_g1_i8.p1 TRINITY_DN6417_c0_g1~~TRINITY_DN6417_c0_g1_i8.p1  ORF type:complete len:130 (-),score=47.18 TRINITY_DN6417_c0_g1_i8:137-526(-)
MVDRISISFDEENKIRVLEPDKFRDTDQLRKDSMDFMKKILAFDETIATLIEVLELQAKKIEIEKLRALGERNKVESEAENRKKKVIELNNLLAERKNELERYTLEYESLVKVEAEQKNLISKLTNNEA